MYCSPTIVWVVKLRRVRWAGHVVGMGERRDLYRNLVGKTEGRVHLGGLCIVGGDNSKMDLQKVRFGYDWLKLPQDRHRWWALVNAVMNFWVP